MTNIENKVNEIKRDFRPKKIVLPESYWEEFSKTETGKKAQKWFKEIKMTNSYAEAKQHNLI